MYILVDVGGTKMRVARSRDLAQFEEPTIIETPQDYGEGLNTLVEEISHIAGSEKVDAISVGLPGVLDQRKRLFYHSPHLPLWSRKSVADDLEKALNTKAILENDTALVALGEAVYGAGKEGKIVVYLTVSTGVGGVRVVDKKIDRAHFGFEPGHQYISLNPPQELEAFISGTAV